jgi:hypothetical protein
MLVADGVTATAGVFLVGVVTVTNVAPVALL